MEITDQKLLRAKRSLDMNCARIIKARMKEDPAVASVIFGYLQSLEETPAE